MPHPSPVAPIPPEFLRQLKKTEALDWAEGMPATELIDRINRMAAWFRPEEIGNESRAGDKFTLRAFRHYQTLGCIDAPQRAGQRVVYRFRQLLQGLLIRRLLWERVPSDRIAWLMSQNDNASLKRMLLDESGPPPRNKLPDTPHPSPQPAEVWRRTTVGPGIELHLHQHREKPDRKRIEHYLDVIRQILETP